MPHARLRREMHDQRKAMFGKQRRSCSAVRKFEFHETERWKFCKFGKARLLERGIVIGIEVVDADHRPAGFGQPPRDMKADKSGCSCDEDSLSRHASVPI